MHIEPAASLCAVVFCAADRGDALARTLDLLVPLSMPLIIVDSSARGDAAESLAGWMCRTPEASLRFVKAPRRRALQAGFAAAKNLGRTHALIVKDYAEFIPENLHALLKSSGENPLALILGCPADAPPRSFLERLSDLVVRLETGLRLHETPGSPRIYPLRLIDMISSGGKRNPGDVEILVRAAWVGCPIIAASLPSPRALQPGRRSYLGALHFTLRRTLTHSRLLARALSGWPHPKYAQSADPGQPLLWRSMWQWCNPLRAWRELRQGGAAGRGEMAAGIALGVFIANTPAYGFQTILALYTARRLHLHPVAVLAGSKASTPPVGPLLIAAAICVGHILLHGSRPQWKNITPFDERFFANVGPILLDWMVGSLVMGVVTAIGAFIAASFLFHLIERRKPGDLQGADAPGGTPSAQSRESATHVSIPPIAYAASTSHRDPGDPPVDADPSPRHDSHDAGHGGWR